MATHPSDMSRDDVVAALRRLANELDGPVAATAMPTGLWFAVRRHFGSADAARRAAGVPGPPRNYKWSEDLVVAEIRRLARRGFLVTESNLRRAKRGDLLAAIALYFGSIVRARELAGAPDPPVGHTGPREKWDSETIVARILERHEAGAPLAKTHAPTKLVKAGMRYFGSWNKAIEAAGLRYADVRLVRPPYQRDELIGLLQNLAEQRPDLTAAELSRRRWYQPLVREFGSAAAALEASGLSGWPRRLWDHAHPRDEVLRLIRVRSRAGASMYVDAVQHDDYHLWYSAVLHFGEWSSALKSAGVETDSPTKNRWNAQRLLQALRARRDAGLSLRPSVVQKEDGRLYASAQAYFGTYKNAARRIVEPTWEQLRWNEARVIRELQRVAAGRDRISARQAGSTLVGACQRHFGTFNAACRAAGLDPTPATRDRSAPDE